MCGPYAYGDLLSIINKTILKGSPEYYRTEMESNGAGVGSIAMGDSILACEWFW